MRNLIVAVLVFFGMGILVLGGYIAKQKMYPAVSVVEKEAAEPDVLADTGTGEASQPTPAPAADVGKAPAPTPTPAATQPAPASFCPQGTEVAVQADGSLRCLPKPVDKMSSAEVDTELKRAQLAALRGQGQLTPVSATTDTVVVPGSCPPGYTCKQDQPAPPRDHHRGNRGRRQQVVAAPARDGDIDVRVDSSFYRACDNLAIGQDCEAVIEAY